MNFDQYKGRLYFARKRKEYSQAEVSKAVKMSQPAYNQLEKGKSQSSSKTPQIAEYLEVNALWLAEGIGSWNDVTTFPEAGSAQDEILILLQSIRKNHPDQLPTVLKILKAIDDE